MNPPLWSGSLLRDLGLIIVAGALCTVIARRLRMPSIVAYLIAGLVLGPGTGAVRVTPGLAMISETGIALLLFLVGLELSFAKVRDVGRVAVVAGLGQVVFTAVIGFVLSRLLGFSAMEALFICSGMTFSSTVIAVKLLDEKKELDSPYGHIAVGCSLVQSLLAIVVLAFLAGLGGSSQEAANGWLWGLLRSFGGMTVLLGFMLAAARWVLPQPFRWAARSPDTLFIWSLAWCFLSVLVAGWLGLSLEIGAFLAGVSLAQLPYNQDLRRRLHPLMNFFMAVFFVSLGSQLNLGQLSGQWWATILLSLTVMLGNTFIYVLLIPRLGYSRETAFLTGLTGAQISEFSFILAGLGVSTGLIPAPIISLMAMIGLITMGTSAYLIIHNHALHQWLLDRGWLRWFPAGGREEITAPPPLRGHVIVVGMNTLGREIVARLHARGERVLAIDTDPHKLAGLPGETMLGNVAYAATLEEAGLERARLVVSALHIEEINDLIAFRCRAAGVPCAVNVVDLSLADNLLELEAAYLMVPKVDGVKLQTRELQRLGLLPP